VHFPVVIFWLVATLVGSVMAEGLENAPSDTTHRIQTPKGAMLRSLVLPGWGQFYNCRVVKGGFIAAAEISSIVGFFIRSNQIHQESYPNSFPKRNIYFFTSVGILIYSLIDAYVDAHLDMVNWKEVKLESGKNILEFKAVFEVPF